MSGRKRPTSSDEEKFQAFVKSIQKPIPHLRDLPKVTPEELAKFETKKPKKKPKPKVATEPYYRKLRSMTRGRK